LTFFYCTLAQLGAKIVEGGRRKMGATKRPIADLWKQLPPKPDHRNRGLTWLNKIKAPAFVQLSIRHGYQNIVHHVLNQNINYLDGNTTGVSTAGTDLQIIHYLNLTSRSTTHFQILVSKAICLKKQYSRLAIHIEASCRMTTIVISTLLQAAYWSVA
jgi:hypothetical protein